MEKYLFIGGSKDGDWIAVNMDTVEFPIMVEGSDFYGMERYKGMYFQGNWRNFLVYILDDNKKDHDYMFAKLLKGYKPSKPSQSS